MFVSLPEKHPHKTPNTHPHDKHANIYIYNIDIIDKYCLEKCLN
jgi:hypothetical protein